MPQSDARCLVLAAMLATPLSAAAQLSLVWSDEFDGTSLNTANWEPMIGDGTAYGIPGWGNNELQYYTGRPENVTVNSGLLTITARQENFGGKQYTSARLRTINKQDFQYGRLEGRIKLPSTTGIWPAFWMLPTGSPYGGWASSGEIDIMESVNIADRVYGTIHFGAPWPGNTSNGNSFVPGPDLSAGFHEYAIEWDPDQIRWYFDGGLYHVAPKEAWFSTAAPGNDEAPFDNPFHFLLNVAVGGNFPGNPNGSSVFPQTLQADWIRAYEFVQTGFLGGPSAVPGTVQAENFDTGYGGLAYQDSDGGNNGGAYRESAVDLEASTVNGFNVGWISNGEWIEYTLDVAVSGDYLIQTQIASPGASGSFRLEFDGVDATGNVNVPITGGFQIWNNVASIVHLNAGEQVMRLVSTGNDYNVNQFQFILISADCLADLTTTGSDNGISDGVVDLSDFSYYLGLWAGNDPAADITTEGACTAGTGDGSVTLSDFSCYLSTWSAGCP